MVIEGGSIRGLRKEQRAAEEAGSSGTTQFLLSKEANFKGAEDCMQNLARTNLIYQRAVEKFRTVLSIQGEY